MKSVQTAVHSIVIKQGRWGEFKHFQIFKKCKDNHKVEQKVLLFVFKIEMIKLEKMIKWKKL